MQQWHWFYRFTKWVLGIEVAAFDKFDGGQGLYRLSHLTCSSNFFFFPQSFIAMFKSLKQQYFRSLPKSFSDPL